MTPPRVLIIDPHSNQEIGRHIHEILERDHNYLSFLVDTFKESRHCPCDLVIAIVLSIDSKQEEHLSELRAQFSDTPFLWVIDPTDSQIYPDDFLLQNSDFLVIPLRKFEVLARLQKLLGRKRVHDQKKIPKKDMQIFGLEQLLGEAASFVAVKQRIPLVARSQATVLLSGETGTGKEIFARTLHYQSRRAGKPFLPVNCGAIPVDLFERELFGHHKGAYTSAWTAQSGLIEEAEGGTLFLDEIETLSLGAQVKLLRFLQDETYHSLGSSKLKQADVWIIASTNQDLSAKVHGGTFREDFFYRLAVMTLTLPPLRERRPDIPLLAAHFLKKYTELENFERQFSSDAMQILTRYSWPGNVRELENIIRQIVALTQTEILKASDLPSYLLSLKHSTQSFRQVKTRVIQEFEKAYITELLDLHDGNITHAAQAAKKERRAFGRLIKKYNLEKDAQSIKRIEPDS